MITNLRDRSVRLPLLLVIVSALVVVVGVVLMFVGGQRVGATWDERIHAVMLEYFFLSGWYGSPDWFVNDEPVTPIGRWPYFVYAPVASLIAHAAAVMAGAEPWGGFSDAAPAHAARHLGTVLIGALGIAAVVITAKQITRSWRWGILAGALLASVPMWIGHGMFNVKDLPVGVGYSLVTLGFVIILQPGFARGGTGSRWPRVGAWAAITGGVLLAVGTRPASGFPMAITAGTFAFLILARWLLQRHRSVVGESDETPGSARRMAIRILDLVGPFLLGYVFLVALYPKGFANPLQLVKETLLISGRFPVNDAVVTNGVWLSQPPPWWYLPTWFGAQLPLLVIAGAFIFVFAWTAGVIRLRQGKRIAPMTVAWLVMSIPVSLQVVLFPLLAIAAQSTMYNAVRQFLFVPPAMAVLAALGIQALWHRLASMSPGTKRQAVHYVVVALVALGLTVPMLAQIRLFPYTYTYFNALTALRPIDGNWATDYWRASGPDLARKTPSSGEVSCIFIDDKQPLRPCAEDATLAPYWDLRATGEIQDEKLGPNEYWLLRENNGEIAPPDGCSLNNAITRPLFGQEITIAQIFRCTLP